PLPHFDRRVEVPGRVRDLGEPGELSRGQKPTRVCFGEELVGFFPVSLSRSLPRPVEQLVAPFTHSNNLLGPKPVCEAEGYRGNGDRHALFFMKKARINGVELDFEVRGTGAPLLLISPVLADGFVPLLAEKDLADRYRLIAYHKRGWVGSTRTSGPVSVADHAADARALLD